MARSDIYEPKQKRSIEKKNHIIIETGIELMTEKGYHHTTTDDIELFAENLLARFLAIHLDHRDIHEELEAMRHSDSEVAALYDKTEAAIILQIPLMTICNLFYP